VGGKIAQLEARKRAAVEREDYDMAKALKADIEKLRVAGEAAAMADANGGGRHAAGAGLPLGRAGGRAGGKDC
jgi:centrosomal protein CEP104